MYIYIYIYTYTYTYAHTSWFSSYKYERLIRVRIIYRVAIGRVESSTEDYWAHGAWDLDGLRSDVGPHIAALQSFQSAVFSTSQHKFWHSKVNF